MRKTLIATTTIALLTAGAGFAAEEAAPASPPAAAQAAGTTMTDNEKAFYALGVALWRNLQQFDLTPAELELVQSALTDAASGVAPKVTLEEARPQLDALRKERTEKRLAASKEAGTAYAAKAAAEPGAVKSESGVIYRETAPGTGASPVATDRVKVHYRGTLVDGTEFDSSYKREKPAEFALNGVIQCWTEGVAKMKVGGKANLVCPPETAYGDRGRPSIPPGATLLFEVELLEIVQQEAPKPAATDAPKPEGE